MLDSDGDDGGIYFRGLDERIDETTWALLRRICSLALWENLFL